MSPRPHDVPDLLLAPVVLAVDARLSELAHLTVTQLRDRIVSDTNMGSASQAEREQSLLRCISYLIDLHGWELELVSRGVRLSHGAHSLVLGLPTCAREYLAGSHH